MEKPSCFKDNKKSKLKKYNVNTSLEYWCTHCEKCWECNG